MAIDEPTRSTIRRAVFLGRAHARMDEAIATLEPIHRRHPDDGPLALALGGMLRDSGQLGRAFEIHGALARRVPDDRAIAIELAMSAAARAIEQQDRALFERAWRIQYPRARSSDVAIETAVPLPAYFVGIEIEGGKVRLRPSIALSAEPRWAAAVALRLLRHLPLWLHAADTVAGPFAVVVDFGDGSDEIAAPARLAFSSARSDIPLIPDFEFVGSGGYRHLLAGPDRPWSDRRPVAFWRGASTGAIPPGGTIDDLPRVRLARLAQRADMAGRLDAGFHILVDQGQIDDAGRAAIEGLMRPYVPAARFAEWRYLVDVDGNTNAWSGLFARLAAGSAVLKIASAAGWRQWYYDRLAPWRNLVSVAADLADLPERIDWLIRHDEEARAIGDAGRALARSLDWESEVRAGVATAVRIGAGRREIAP